MKLKKFSTEDLLYLLIFIFGLTLRLVDLGSASLNNAEAALAMQALSVVRGLPEITIFQPLYTASTAFLFFFFGSNELLARLAPAVIGSLVVLPVYMLRERIGRIPALLLSFFLMIDPAFMAESRQADSLGITIVLCMLLAASIIQKRKIWSGILFGLVLLCGMQLWLGLLILAVSFLLSRFFLIEDNNPIFNEIKNLLQFIKQEKWFILLPALFVIGLWGGLFLIFPQNIVDIFSGLIEFIQSWFVPGGGSLYNAAEKIIGLVVYEPLIIFAGLMGSIWMIVKKDKFGIFLIFWWVSAFIITVIYPSGKINDFIWMVLPLWLIVVEFLTWTFRIVEVDERKWFAGFVCMTGTIMVFLCLAVTSFLSTSSIISYSLDQTELFKRIAVMFGGVVLLLSTTYLIGFGWSTRLAFSQWIFGVSLVLTVITFSGAWSVAGLNKDPGLEMWRLAAYPDSGKLLEKTIDDYSLWNTGNKKSLDVAVIGVDTPFIRWMLRDQREVKFDLAQATALSDQISASILITQGENQPSSQSSYRGSAFVIEKEPSWSLMSSQEWLRWIIFRGKAPMNQKTIVLWIKNEKFPGGGLVSETISNSVVSPVEVQDAP